LPADTWSFRMPRMSLTDDQLRAILRCQVDATGSIAEWSRLHGFTRSFVSDVLAGNRGISERLGRLLGYEKVQSWRKLTPEDER